MLRSLRLFKSCNPTQINHRFLQTDLCNWFIRNKIRGKGFDPNDPLCIIDRKHVIEKIKEKLEFKVVLVKAPPRSSKTTTIGLIARNALNLKSYEQVICLSGKSSLDEQISSQSAQNEPKSFIELLSTKVKTLVMIDEGHLAFDTAFPNYATLWSCLEGHKSKKESPVDVVMFASVGEKSEAMAPIEFTDRNTVFFNDLSFAICETQQLAEQWNNLEPPARPFLDSSGVDLMPKKMSEVVQLTSTVVNTIFTLTMGHVGLTRLLIELVCERFLDNERHSVPNYPVSEGEIMSFLLDSDLQHAVGRTKVVPSGWQLRDQEAVRRILMQGSVHLTNNMDLKDSFARLRDTGVVVSTDNDVMMFSSPLMATKAMRTLFGDVPTRPTKMPQFEQFLFDTVALMNYMQLKLGKVREADEEGRLHKTVEPQLQNEWYCAAMRLLPTSCIVIASYGRFHPVTSSHGEEKWGQMDFYINGVVDKLGVEVLRNSVDLKEHLQRFAVGGKYTGIPLSKWKVVNFVEVSGEPKNHVKKQKVVHDGELRILWSPDCVDFVALDSAGVEQIGKFVHQCV